MARRDLDQWLWLVGAELQKLSEEITPASPKLARRSGWQPPVDVVETEDVVMIRAELAGIDPADVRIGYHPGRRVLTLRGVRHENREATCVRAAHQLEINYGEFACEVRLPEIDLDLSHLQARYRDGILTIAVPKSIGSPIDTLRLQSRS